MSLFEAPDFEADVEEDWQFSFFQPFEDLFMKEERADLRIVPLLNAVTPPKVFFLKKMVQNYSLAVSST